MRHLDQIFDNDALERELLATVPEIERDYQALRKEMVPLSEKDIEDLRTIEAMHRLPPIFAHQVGITIVFETLLVPKLIELSEGSPGTKRLSEISAWIETLAINDSFAIRNLVAGSICQPLITTFEEHLPKLYPFLEPATRALCVMQFSAFAISETTRKLFQVDS